MDEIAPPPRPNGLRPGPDERGRGGFGGRLSARVSTPPALGAGCAHGAVGAPGFRAALDGRLARRGGRARPDAARGTPDQRAVAGPSGRPSLQDVDR